MKVIWTAAARSDRRSIIAYLGELNPAAAIRIQEGLVLATDNLATFPYRGRPGLVRGTRELVARPPYVVIYEVEESLVRVLRIWHAAQER